MKTEITQQEAIDLIKEIFNKPCLFKLFYAGVLDIEVGEIKEIETKTPGGKTFEILKGDYSFLIEGNWSIVNNNKVITNNNYNCNEEVKYIESIFTTLSKLKIKNIILTHKDTNIELEDNYFINILNNNRKNSLKWNLQFPDSTYLIFEDRGYYIKK